METKKCIGLIAAMPDEIRPLLERVASCRRERENGLTCYRFSIGDRNIVLAESGMGMRNAARTAHQLISTDRPEYLVNFGFAGAVTPDLAVGDIVLARRVLFRHNRLFAEQQGISAELGERSMARLASAQPGSSRAVEGTFITTTGIADKSELASQLPQGAVFPVVDMETSAVAQAALKEKVPLLAVRAISDSAEENLGFTIEEFADRTMKIRIHRVMLTVARKPWIIPQLLRLRQNTKMAGDNLARAMLAILEKLTE